MEYLLICSVSLMVSGLTLFSGFGLGTLLMPAFALFFPLPVAIAATAVVHLANNIFKVMLIGKKADMGVVLRFALPGACAAMIGAYMLTFLENSAPLLEYTLGQRTFQITPVKIVIGCIITLFALIDILPIMRSLSFDKKYISFGGALSGLFGGLSGHQGALRTAFLIKCGLPKEVFIGTGVVSAVIVDFARLIVYGLTFYGKSFSQMNEKIAPLVLAACISAFIGAYFGKRILQKMTFRSIQLLVGSMLVLLGCGLCIGLV